MGGWGGLRGRKSWGLGSGALFILAARPLLVDLDLVRRRCQLVVFFLGFYLLVLLMCKGKGGGQWPAGVSKASKSCSRLTGDTRRLCRRTVCVCVCGQTRRRPLGKISLLLYFGGSGKKPLSWVNRPPSPHTHTPPSLLNDQLLHQCKCKLSIPAVMSGAGSGVRLRGS